VNSHFKRGKALGVRRLDAALNIRIYEIVICEGGVKPPHSKARFARISIKTMWHQAPRWALFIAFRRCDSYFLRIYRESFLYPAIEQVHIIVLPAGQLFERAKSD
jgi:hypothetical protein